MAVPKDGVGSNDPEPFLGLTPELDFNRRPRPWQLVSPATFTLFPPPNNGLRTQESVTDVIALVGIGLDFAFKVARYTGRGAVHGAALGGLSGPTGMAVVGTIGALGGMSYGVYEGIETVKNALEKTEAERNSANGAALDTNRVIKDMAKPGSSKSNRRIFK